MTDGKSGRLVSLDVFRGYDMLFIMGLQAFVVSLCTACGWSDGWLVRQFDHPEWLGLTLYDTIFPTFIFIAGVSFPYSSAKQLSAGRSRLQVAGRVLKRAAVLFLLGMVYARYFGGAPFRFGTVLGRIGIAWACGAWLYLLFGAKTRALIAVLLLAGYWAANLLVPAPGHLPSEIWTPQGNIVAWFDWTYVSMFSRLSPGTAELPFDNQTCLSNVMATVTAMLGMFVGEFVRKTERTMSGDRRVAILLAAAAGLAGLGCVVAFGCGRFSFPFSKVLWSPSFTLAVGAYSVALFAVFHWLIDVKGWWQRTLFFRVIGVNAITIYLAQPLFGLSACNRMLFGRLTGLLPELWGAVALQALYAGLCWTFLYVLFRKNIFLKV